MTVRFVLLVNKQGATRIARYFDPLGVGTRMGPQERRALEAEIVRKSLCRSADSLRTTQLFQQGKYEVAYRRYASLFFIVGFDVGNENELAILEWIHCLVETLDSLFSNVCELDILYNYDTVNSIIDEMLYNGHMLETNRRNILQTVAPKQQEQANL